MEDVGLLNPDSSVDLFCLHYVFVPRLNHQLTVFKETYSNHPVRTAGNQSPYQLWISGMALCSGDSAALQGLEEETIEVSV